MDAMLPLLAVAMTTSRVRGHRAAAVALAAARFASPALVALACSVCDLVR
jgi:hypothetical protein